jgi:hypothetical protein
MKGKRFDPVFKKDIVKLYLSGERTGASLAEELGFIPIRSTSGRNSMAMIRSRHFQGPANSNPMRTNCVKRNEKLSNWKMR